MKLKFIGFVKLKNKKVLVLSPGFRIDAIITHKNSKTLDKLELRKLKFDKNVLPYFTPFEEHEAETEVDLDEHLKDRAFFYPVFIKYKKFIRKYLSNITDEIIPYEFLDNVLKKDMFDYVSLIDSVDAIFELLRKGPLNSQSDYGGHNIYDVLLPEFYLDVIEGIEYEKETEKYKNLYEKSIAEIKDLSDINGVDYLLNYGKDDKQRTFTGKLRYKILKRDNNRCKECGRSPEDNISLEIDHKIPWKWLGRTTYKNGITLCRDCNRAKHHWEEEVGRDEVMKMYNI